MHSTYSKTVGSPCMITQFLGYEPASEKLLDTEHPPRRWWPRIKKTHASSLDAQHNTIYTMT